MKFLLLTLLAALVSGCADTPENRQFWQQMGAGLQGAANNLNQQTAQMRQNNSNNIGNTGTAQQQIWAVACPIQHAIGNQQLL